MWYNNYIDIPYLDGGRDRSGLDCWGLARLVYSDQYGISLPSFGQEYITAKDHEKLAEIFSREKESWEQLDAPEPGCLVLFRILGAEVHVGIYVGDNKFLHIREGVNSVVESCSSQKWSHRIVGYFKYVENKATLVARTNPLKTQTITVPIIEGTSLQFLADWLQKEHNISEKSLSRSIFLLNGVPIPKEQWETTRVKAEDSLAFRAVPGDDETFRVVGFLVVAFIAVQTGMYVGGAGETIFGTGLNMGSGTAFAAQAAVTIAGTALVNAIAPIPEQPVMPSATPSEAQKFINGANNQATQWAGIPIVLGKMRMTPPLGAFNNVRFGGDSNILNGSGNEGSGGVAGSDTYIDMLLIWGYGPLVIDQSTLRIGQVGYYNLDANGNIIGQNYDQAIQITLDRITTPSTGLLKTFNGIYGTDVQQEYPNLALEYAGRPPISTTNNGTGPPPWIPTPRPTTDTGWAEYGFTQPSDKISVSVNFPQGLRATILSGQQAGQERPAPVGLELQYKVGNGLWTPWPGSTAQGSDPGHYTVGGKVSPTYVAGYNNTYEGYIFDEAAGQIWGIVSDYIQEVFENQRLSGTMIPDGFTWTVTLTRTDLQGTTPRWNENDLVSVRIRRTTGSDTEVDFVRFTHTAIVSVVTSTRNAKPAVDPSGVKIAKTALTLKATDEINGQVDGINAIVQTYCKDWDSASQSWILRGTSNPASLYRYVLQHPANPQPVLDSAIDLVALQRWHEYCATQRTITYNGTSYTYNLQYNNIVAGQARSVLDMLREIAAAGRGSPAMVDGKWSVVIDEPKAAITQHFSPHNSWGFEATKMLPRMPEALKVQFNDRNSEYVQKEIIVSYTSKDAQTAQLLEAISLPGVTSVAEAVSHAKWHLAQIKLRPEVYTINTDIEYIVCNRGDRVKLTHWVPQWGGGSGRVKNTYGSTPTTIRVLELDELITINPDGNNAIRVRSSSTGGSTEVVVLKSFAVSSYSQSGNIVTVYTQINHPLVPGDSAVVSGSTSSVINATVGTVESVVYSAGLPVGFTYTVPTSNTVPLTNTNGTVSLVSDQYSRVSLSETVNTVSPGDLFLFGEYGSESQDLLVTKIEPTNGKTARITLVDYGVTPTYNIFTDYSGDTITSNTVFEAQINKVPELFSQVGDHVPVLDPTTFISDERAMRVISPGVFEYRMKIPFSNPQGLSTDISTVVAEIYPANNPDTSGSRKYRVPISANSIDFPDLVELEAYKFRLRYETKLGRVGPWTDWFLHGVVGKTNPPAQVTLVGTGYGELQSGIKLLWNDNSEVDIQYYEVRTSNTGWGDDQHIFRGLTTELPVTPVLGNNTWYIKAVDYAGNYSTLATAINYTYQPVPNISNISESYSSSSLTEATVTLSWVAPTGSIFGISAYILEYDTVSIKVNSTSVTVPANWLGNRTFTVKTIDLIGTVSSGYSEVIEKFAPAAVSNFRVQVIDNNVLLYWNNPARTTLPIAHVLIKRSSLTGTWETAEVVGTKSGEFTSFSELVAGEYVYYVAAVDTDNRESAYVQKAVNVAQPPDFVFYGDHISTFTSKSNVVATYSNSATYNNELLLPVNISETYQGHWTAPNPDWVGPSSQIAAGYPYYIQPGLSSGSYTEEIDFGNIIGSSQLNLSVLGSNLVGSCTQVVNMYTKANPGDAYVLTTGFATNFRFVKIEIVVTQITPGSVYVISSIYLKLSSKQITEANNATVVASKIINFEKEFIDVSSVNISPGGTTPISTTYDLKDVVRYCTYSINSNVCTVTLPGTDTHGLVTGQLVRVYFTSGVAPNGRYLITSTPTASSFTLDIVTPNTSGNVTAYANSMVVYAFNPTNGQPVTAPISYLIRGY